MSTLKVTDIQSNGTGFNDVVSFQNASGTENGTLCRAFVNFNGDTGTGNDDVTIRSSFNVSSVNDDNTGLYTINLTSSFADTNYILLSTTTSAGSTTGTVNTVAGETDGGANRTTSSAQIRTQFSNGSNSDRTTVSVAFFS